MRHCCCQRVGQHCWQSCATARRSTTAEAAPHHHAYCPGGAALEQQQLQSEPYATWVSAVGPPLQASAEAPPFLGGTEAAKGRPVGPADLHALQLFGWYTTASSLRVVFIVMVMQPSLTPVCPCLPVLQAHQCSTPCWCTTIACLLDSTLCLLHHTRACVWLRSGHTLTLPCIIWHPGKRP